jgi:SAM-dependent methyltransferase
MISERLLEVARCPACRRMLAREGTSLCCDGCGTRYDALGDYVDLRPRESFEEQTKYLDETLHADARHETVSPPLLSAGVRYGMLRRFLKPGPGDRVLDLGCGSGRVLVWNRPLGACQAGIDVSPFFSVEARRDMDLALGDLRRLPFADGAFNKAYALDVFEHLSREALQQVMAEASRVLEPGGWLFVYSHVRKNAWIAGGLRLINRLAHRLERAGLMDVSQERLRKTDHLNPLADIPDLEATTEAAGFRIARIRYYTPLLAGLIENILVRVVEHRLATRTAGNPAEAGSDAERPDDAREGARAARTAAKARIARGGVVAVALHALTWLLKLDVVLWGRVRSGPFFALLVKERAS